jgi:acyl-coenzyme A thioesterase PaaI-like protein
MFSHCYGCGRLNEKGLGIKSYWDGEESVCSFIPREEHTSFTGFAYGGLIASVIDCHSTGTAAAAAHRSAGRDMGSDPPLRFVTASLHVDFLKPTPIVGPLELRSRVKEIKERKVVVETDLRVNGTLCARGLVVAVRIPDSMVPGE